MCAAQCIKRHHLLLLISTAILNDSPESPRLQLHLHQECPIRVICLGVGRVATPTANLTNHALGHNSIFGGVVVTGSLASRHRPNKCHLLEPCPRHNPQVAGKIRAKNTRTTHANTMELISFWCSKLGYIFWLYSSVYIDLLHGK
jgi:hypothetical protein